jgi:hypothetical protein
MSCGAKDKGGSMSYRRSLGAFFSAAALIASLSPAVAFAKTTGKGITDVDDATINVTGLEKGDTVTAYQVFDAYIDSNNVLKYTPATGLPADYDTIDELGALTTADAQRLRATPTRRPS